jgi:chemotaxis protein MotB
MAGKGGGAWKVAYADFVTAMMAFFMVMWITAQSKSVKQAVSQYFSDPHGTSGKPSGISTKAGSSISFLPSKRVGDAPYVQSGKGAQGKGDGATEHDLEDDDPQIKKIKSNPNLFILHEGNRALVGATVRFTNDSVVLDDWSKARLIDISKLFLGKPHRIEVRGHAVRRPAGSQASTAEMWRLCFERSVVTMNFLIEQGVEPERIRLSQAGTSEPYDEDTESEWHLQNARVEVIMLGEYVNEPKPTLRTREGKLESSDAKHDRQAHDATKPNDQKHGGEQPVSAPKKSDVH